MKKDLIYEKVNTIYVLALITAIVETVLLVPVLGGAIILSMFWIPLLVMIGLYIAGLVMASQLVGSLPSGKLKTSMLSVKSNFILGIILSAVSIIPIVGWVCHIVMAIVMWTLYSRMCVIRNDVNKDSEDKSRKNVTPNK